MINIFYYRMNIYKRLPDDIQEKIDFKLHQSYMKDLMKDIKLANPFHFLNWKQFDNCEQYDLIKKYYPTDIIYCLHDDEDNLLNPESIFFEGKCMINENEDEYKSRVLINPTISDVFIEIDKYYKRSVYLYRRFLEIIDVDYETIFDDNVYKIDFFLGS